MKRVVYLTWLLPVAAVVFALLGRFPGADLRAAPPLSLEGYLDEVLPEAKPADTEITVDNSACYVCHANYEEEELVISHAKEDVGCIDCHGVSYEHRDDEDNITPPDEMYAGKGIDAMCATCHDEHDVTAKDVLARWKERCPAKTDPKQIVCTDCHYRHRLAFRTVWWDKTTGELIIRKEGERTKSAEDLTDRGGR